MNWKIILATTTILLSGNISAQTSDSYTTKNQRLNDFRFDSRYLIPGVHETSISREWETDDRVSEARVRERIAAERGDAIAQFNLALSYYRGQGVKQDYAKAVKWLYKAAEQGFVEAQYSLAGMYTHGLGVPQDYAKAANWYRKAAEQGFASAQKNLGVQYGLGQGVPQSHADAFIWSCFAATTGDEGATTNCDFAASQLSPQDLEAAQKRALTLYEEIQHRTEEG